MSNSYRWYRMQQVAIGKKLHNSYNTVILIVLRIVLHVLGIGNRILIECPAKNEVY